MNELTANSVKASARNSWSAITGQCARRKKGRQVDGIYTLTIINVWQKLRIEDEGIRGPEEQHQACSLSQLNTTRTKPNKMSDNTVANNTFDMKLATDPPVTTAGTVSLPPLDIIENISPSGNTNGGAYTGTASHGFAVRALLATSSPCAKATLVIYFDSTKCRVDAVSPGVIITYRHYRFRRGEEKGKFYGHPCSRTSCLHLHGEAESNPVADTNQCSVTITAARN
ncbi:hypothetical protein B0H14DRAFT_2558095 [Mycena olivaceomarginata]|nr:hypothetical protein B0H14DRAFT_2558095 [Mycena olivaceomarginata]